MRWYLSPTRAAAALKGARCLQKGPPQRWGSRRQGCEGGGAGVAASSHPPKPRAPSHNGARELAGPAFRAGAARGSCAPPKPGKLRQEGARGWSGAARRAETAPRGRHGGPLALFLRNRAGVDTVSAQTLERRARLGARRHTISAAGGALSLAAQHAQLQSKTGITTCSAAAALWGGLRGEAVSGAGGVRAGHCGGSNWHCARRAAEGVARAHRNPVQVRQQANACAGPRAGARRARRGGGAAPVRKCSRCGNSAAALGNAAAASAARRGQAARGAVARGPPLPGAPQIGRAHV